MVVHSKDLQVGSTSTIDNAVRTAKDIQWAKATCSVCRSKYKEKAHLLQAACIIVWINRTTFGVAERFECDIRGSMK